MTDDDQLAKAFSLSFNIDNVLNHPTSQQHPRFADYKRVNTVDQEERRRRLLANQKKFRDFAVALARDISEDGSDVEEEEMEVAQSKYRPKKRKPKVMFSEWLVDIPDNMEEDFIVIPIPIGRRNVVVACNGITYATTKFGAKVKVFPSSLPGGHRNQRRLDSRKNTIIDTIYHLSQNVFYALDLMVWDGYPFYNCETSFRFYWLKSKLEENPSLQLKERLNPTPILPLPFFTASKEGVLSALTTFTVDELDGLLFYHKQAYYRYGSTPLVGWLKPYMITDVLKLDIPEEYKIKPLTQTKQNSQDAVSIEN